MARFRLGAVPYLNGKPLVYGIEQSPGSGVSLSVAVPSVLVRQLRAGELDAALVSSIACFAEPGLVALRGSGIASRGRIDSIRLFCAVEPAEVRRLALDASSRTSAALARILLAERYGARPECIELPPNLEGMLAVADAALIIGDPALQAHHLRPWPRAGLRSLDLGELWYGLTGLPFVFAVWAARRDVDAGPLVRILAQARAAGRAHLDAIADEAAGRLGLPQVVCRSYLRDILVHDLGHEEWEGLRRFREMAISHGLVPPDAPPLTIRGEE